MERERRRPDHLIGRRVILLCSASKEIGFESEGKPSKLLMSFIVSACVEHLAKNNASEKVSCGLCSYFLFASIDLVDSFGAT